MATISWPSSLPDYLLVDAYNESFPNTTIRTQMDEGPAKVRRWGTAAIRPITGTQILDGTEYSTLDTFYNTTSQGGSLRFDWTHPITGTSVEFRFVSPPTVTAIGNYFFNVTLNLEIMP